MPLSTSPKREKRVKELPENETRASCKLVIVAYSRLHCFTMKDMVTEQKSDFAFRLNCCAS